MLNLNVNSKCVAKCKAKYLENIQIPKETTPTADCSGFKSRCKDRTAKARHGRFSGSPRHRTGGYCSCTGCTSGGSSPGPVHNSNGKLSCFNLSSLCIPDEGVSHC